MKLNAGACRSRRRRVKKKKRGGHRRAVAAKHVNVRKERDYIAVHARFFKIFSQALLQELYHDPEDRDPDDPDETPKQRIVRWVEFLEYERLEKGIDLTRYERPHFNSYSRV